MVPFPKKNYTTNCKSFRAISHIYSCDLEFGFRKEKGTRDTIGFTKTLIEIFLEESRKVYYICFTDCEKSFNRVD